MSMSSVVTRSPSTDVSLQECVRAPLIVALSGLTEKEIEEKEGWSSGLYISQGRTREMGVKK